MLVGCKWVHGLSARLSLAFCIRGLVVFVTLFIIVVGFISTICFVVFVVFAFGFGTCVVIMVVDNVGVGGAFFDGWGVIVGFVIGAVGGDCRLLVILWLACCSH